MALTAEIYLALSTTFTKTMDLSTLTDKISTNGKKTIDLADGTGDDQADVLWHDQRTVAPGANDDLDLAGTLTDAFGDTVTIADLKVLFISSAAANVDDLRIGGAAGSAISTLFGATADYIILKPNGVFLIATPESPAYAVTAGSADVLRITHGDGGGSNATYDIIVIGTSAIGS